MSGYQINVDVKVQNWLVGMSTSQMVSLELHVSQGANRGWQSFIPGVTYTRGWPRIEPDVSPFAIADAYNYGVYMEFTFSGSYGSFSWQTLIKSFTTYLVLMSLAPMVTDIIMLNFMGERSNIYKDVKHTLADKNAIQVEDEIRQKEERARIEVLFEPFDNAIIE